MVQVCRDVACERVGDGWVVLAGGGVVHNVTGPAAEVLTCAIEGRRPPVGSDAAVAALVKTGIVTAPLRYSRRGMLAAGGAAAVGLTSVALPMSGASASPAPPPEPTGQVSTLDLPGGGSFLFPSGSEADLGYLITPAGSNQIVEVFLPVMATVGTLTLESGETIGGAVVTDGEFLYLGTTTAPGMVIKVRLQGLERIDTLVLAPGEDFLQSAVLANGFGYFATATDPGQVVRVNLSTMTRAGTYTLLPGGVPPG